MTLMRGSVTSDIGFAPPEYRSIGITFVTQHIAPFHQSTPQLHFRLSGKASGSFGFDPSFGLILQIRPAFVEWHQDDKQHRRS